MLRCLLPSFTFSRKINNKNFNRSFCKVLNWEQPLKENPYYEKYADKIVALEKASPEEFKQLLENKRGCYEKEPIVKRESETNVFSKRQKALEQVMKTDALEEKSAEEIGLIWKEYHQSKDGIYAVLPAYSYDKMCSRSRKYPLFLLPLPRAQGYEFMMLQFLEHSCYFTTLLNYQAFKENAPICLTMTYFTEFQANKGIVLMRGEYDDKSLKTHEAQCLANQIQLYYGGTDEKKERLLCTFNKQPETFRHMDLISNFEYSFNN